jgi:hypothetical protein
MQKMCAYVCLVHGTFTVYMMLTTFYNEFIASNIFEIKGTKKENLKMKIVYLRLLMCQAQTSYSISNGGNRNLNSLII